MVSRLGILAVVVALVAAGAAAGIWFAVGHDNASHPQATEDVQAILGDPQSYYGRRVTIEAQVNQALTPNAFTVGDPQPDPSDLLVVRYDRTVSVRDNQLLRITGTVQPFHLSDYAAKVGVSELNAHILDAFQSGPAVVATKVEIAQTAR